jgi:hypothetical protein
LKIVAMILLLTTPALAAAGDLEWFGAGASGRWHDQLAELTGGGSAEFGTPDTTPSNSDFGRKFKAGALSLLVPGAGQLLVTGDTTKGWVMLGTEVATWGVYLLLDHHADAWANDYREYASIHAGADGDHPEWYWQAVGRYMDSDAYYESQLRDARAFGEPTPAPLPESDAWQWTSDANQEQYQELRASATSAYDNRDIVILFAVLNRAFSAYDAVRNAGAEPEQPALGVRVLGLDLALDASPSLTRPEARCGLGRSF